MRYVIALLAILLAGLALRSVWESDEDPGSSPQNTDDPPQSEEIPDGKGLGAEDGMTPVAVNTTAPRPELGDEIAETLYDIIYELVTQKVGLEDQEALEGRLLVTLRSLELGNPEAMSAGAKATIDTMLTDASRFMTGDAAAVTSVQESAFAAVADKYAQKLRRGLAYGGLNTTHDGTFVSSTLEIQLPEGVREAPWGVLGGFEWRDGMKLPDGVLELKDQNVGIAGYMMSIGQFEDIHEFLLVESQWSCCFGIPPEVHQVVVVTIPDEDPGIELVNVPIVIMGRLDVGEEEEEGWVTSVYRITAETVEILE